MLFQQSGCPMDVAASGKERQDVALLFPQRFEYAAHDLLRDRLCGVGFQVPVVDRILPAQA